MKPRSNVQSMTILKGEWQKYLDQTRTHEKLLRDLLSEMGLDPRKKLRDDRWSDIKAKR